MRKPHKLSIEAIGIATTSVVCALVMWELSGRIGLFDPRLVPGPIAVVKGLWAMATEKTLLDDAIATLFRVLLGFVAGTTFGILAGLITGLIGRGRYVLEPLVQLLRPIPAVALIPIAIAWFGIGELEKIVIVTWASFFPMWVNTHAGIRSVPQVLIWTGLTLGASRARITREIVIPAALPFLISGARVALGLSFAATVVAEMSGAANGLGYRSFINHAGVQRDKMLAAIVVIGVLGAAIDRGYQLAVRKSFPWLS
jgi:ABC-type nitrate/sulfonate/bicarbonate transport system permease component